MEIGKPRVDGLAIALEMFMFIDMDHHIEIAGGTATPSAFTLAGEPHARAGIDPCTGMRILTFLLRLTSPSPWQSLQGSVIIWPEP